MNSEKSRTRIKGIFGGLRIRDHSEAMSRQAKDRLIDHMHETDCRRFVYYFHSLTAKRNNNNGWYNHI